MVEYKGDKEDCNYLRNFDWDALPLLLWANNEGSDVILEGTVKNDCIKLNQLLYNEDTVNINRNPYEYVYYYRPPYRGCSGYYDSFTRWVIKPLLPDGE